MTQQPLFGVEPDFPWPAPSDGSPDPSSMHGLADAMTWPGLTPAERCLAMIVGDGAGGPGSESHLARTLEVSEDEIRDLLWALLRKGFLTHVARWWA